MQSDHPDEIAAINTTPLVDVMLVLLIIFLITVPVVTAAIPVTLPRQPAPTVEASDGAITLTIDRQGRVFWDGTALADDAALSGRLHSLAATAVIRLRGDDDVVYGPVGRVIQLCRDAGVERIGFVTVPLDAAGE